ncbi:acyl carrier protein [Streptomyces sp. NPDC052040]|uniref:acyl carrier protein n=1 Tax=unclassified Streptomyces TaxID=2593676 RepID=UPI0037D06DA9
MTEDIVKTVRTFIGEHVRDTELRDDRDIFATGSVSSLFAVQLVMWVERTFGITVHPTDLDIDNFRTVNDVVRFVESRQAAPA